MTQLGWETNNFYRWPKKKNPCEKEVNVIFLPVLVFQHIEKKAADWNVGLEIIAMLKFNIENTFKCHKKKSVDIEVDFLRMFHKKSKRQ